MDSLLSLTVRSQVIEKLAVAINGGLFLTGRVLESEDHQAIIAVHGYLQNLYLYATEGTDDFRRYLLVDTLLVPNLSFRILSAVSTMPPCSHAVRRRTVKRSPIWISYRALETWAILSTRFQI